MNKRVQVRLLDAQATEPVRKANRVHRTIPHLPRSLRLASIRITFPSHQGSNKSVRLTATVGVRGVTGIAQIRFRIFRDGREIYTTQQGIESAGSERTYTVTFQAFDDHVPSGRHTYTLRVTNATPGTRAAVVGPISFSGLAISKRQINCCDSCLDSGKIW